MSIVRLQKLTLCGLAAEKMVMLEKLQILGEAHLIALQKPKIKSETNNQKITESTVQALKYLMQCTKKRQQISDSKDFSITHIVTNVLQLQQKLRTLADQRDFILSRIEEISPWGDFNLSPEINLGGIKFWFYIIPKRAMKLLKDDLIFQVVHVNNTDCFVVVLSKIEPSVASVPFPRTHTGKISLSELTKDLQNIELELEDKQAERESLTRWITLISLNLLENEDAIALKEANTLCQTDQNLFVIQAWIAKNKATKFIKFAKKNALVYILEDIQTHDTPPTLLTNPSLFRGGEEVVKFYQTPAYNSWDPSIVLFFSFAFFFAMILSDAGYAVLFGLVLAIKWSKLGNSQQGQRLRILAIITILFSILWGILVGGYFGYTPIAESFAGSLKILDINDFDAMMPLSIGVGVIHIMLANSINAYQSKTRNLMLASLGWVCAVLGGFILWLIKSNILIDLLFSYSAYTLLTLGLSLLLFFSSEKSLNKPSDLIWKILDGMKNISRVSKIFGDILSYMRLFALGLASASLALTFNQLAEQVYSSPSGLGVLLSLLILILGHSLNLMLCLMSGVVHGLRLNFIEFYNWSISDEGYAFKAFTKKGGR